MWKVRTRSATVALRVFEGGVWGGPFWSGLGWLFGLRPQDAEEVAARHHFLRAAGGVAVPEVLCSGSAGGLSYLVMEWMQGRRREGFQSLSVTGLAAFGRHLARLHARSFSHAGLLPHPGEVDRDAFSGRLREVMPRLVETFYSDRSDLAGALGEMLVRAESARPELFAPVMIDIDISQYLCGPDGSICALVDTDACVSGPRELDFINLEYLLAPEQARVIAGAYAEILPLPDLAELRPLYRYLCLLLEVQGSPPLAEWMAQPALF